jgi:hypothetical protein
MTSLSLSLSFCPMALQPRVGLSLLQEFQNDITTTLKTKKLLKVKATVLQDIPK